MTRRLLPLLPLLLLAGCGFSPLYSGGSHGPVAATLAGVDVAPISGEAGWLVRGAIRDRLAVAGDGTPRYRLQVVLDDQIGGFGVRRDDSVTRERRSLRARWQLVDIASGQNLIDDVAASDMGLDVTVSEYATIAAERTALERLADAIAEQIIQRVAQYGEATAQPAAR